MNMTQTAPIGTTARVPDGKVTFEQVGEAFNQMITAAKRWPT